MARVDCTVEEVEQLNEQGALVPAVKVTCGRCDHCTTSFGTGEKSIKRCLVLLREECPEEEENYYRVDE